MAETRRPRTTAAVVTAAVVVGLGVWAAVRFAGWPGAPEADPDPRTLLDPAEVRVEVLNGAGSSGIAREATYGLRSAGFDVVFFGNAGRFDHERSFVLDRTGTIERAKAVAAALRIDSVGVAVDPSLMLDVTVVLGRDWRPDPPPPEGWADRLKGWMDPDSATRP